MTNTERLLFLAYLIVLVLCIGALGYILGQRNCSCANPCATVTQSLAAVTSCADFTVTSCDCPCTQYAIDERLMALGCDVWHTDVAGCTYTVTMGEAQP